VTLDRNGAVVASDATRRRRTLRLVKILMHPAAPASAPDSSNRSAGNT
jgi:hypothetical protein